MHKGAQLTVGVNDFRQHKQCALPFIYRISFTSYWSHIKAEPRTCGYATCMFMHETKAIIYDERESFAASNFWISILYSVLCTFVWLKSSASLVCVRRCFVFLFPSSSSIQMPGVYGLPFIETVLKVLIRSQFPILHMSGLVAVRLDFNCSTCANFSLSFWILMEVVLESLEK